jgi:hypothetical protein
MYPAVVSAGPRARAKPSQMELCAPILKIHLHLKMWLLKGSISELAVEGWEELITEFLLDAANHFPVRKLVFCNALS